MARRSISRSARAGYISIILAGSLISDITSRWIRGGTTFKEEDKLFKEAIDSLNNAMDFMSDHLEKRTLEGILEEGKLLSIAVMPRKDIPEGNTVINNVALDLLLDKALYWCNPCDVTDHTVCGLRVAFENAGLPPYDDGASDRCKYCYKIKPGKKPITTRKDFIDYCQEHYEITPQEDLLEAFDELIAYNNVYYEKTGVTEKILRKFMEFHRGRTL